jgi:hypothetical protein
MAKRITRSAVLAFVLLTAALTAAADEWPQIFEGTKGDDYVFLMLRQDGGAVYMQRTKRPDGDIWLFYDDAAKWKRTADEKTRPNLSVWTTRFRFDYISEKDQLIEWDKMGAQRTLKRQQNRALHD